MSEVTAKNTGIGFIAISRKILMRIYAFFSYVVMSLLGLLVLAITMLSFFRNGNIISDLSIIEIAAMFWMFLCVRRIYQLSTRGVGRLINFLRLFSYSGWFFLWSALGLYFFHAFLSSEEISYGFFYSNKVEFFLLLMIVFSFGLAAFVANKSAVFSENKSDMDGGL